MERLLRHDRERPADALLVGGPGTATGALVRSLPPVLADRLIGTARLNPTELTAAAVVRAARKAHATHGPAAER